MVSAYSSNLNPIESLWESGKKSAIFGKFPITITTPTAKSDVPIFDVEIYWGKVKVDDGKNTQ